ncbi:MAG: nucleoside-diphosphate sugar epimerase [Acidimicrobiales bacterium]|nr:nucleoside-diphosphate sugar epimerase [Acidimicrobiales bacterium]
MSEVLVTGGTGVLGTRLVPILAAAGHDVRVLTRRTTPSGLAAGTTAVLGDVRTGTGLEGAVAGVDVVIHAATSAPRRARATEVDGTRHMLEVAHAAGVRHFVYVSIVGVDRHRLPYYEAKREAERLVEASPVGWTIQRATQFHDLLDRFLGWGVFPTTKRMAFQPVDPAEVAVRLADLVEANPTGRAPDFGGPEILTVGQLGDARRRLTGRRTVVIRVPRFGALRDFDDGQHLAPGHMVGRTTWSDWLARRSY